MKLFHNVCLLLPNVTTRQQYEASLQLSLLITYAAVAATATYRYRLVLRDGTVVDPTQANLERYMTGELLPARASPARQKLQGVFRSQRHSWCY
jgi:ferric-dicitrate binding protein FerR (iron transport regulator)